MLVQVYRGEDRLLVVPIVICRMSENYKVFSRDYQTDDVGKTIKEMFSFIRNEETKMVLEDNKNQIPVWKRNSKYKSYKSFVRNNILADIEIIESHIEVTGVIESEYVSGMYGPTYKEIDLPIECSTEELGTAVEDVLDAVENYYAKRKNSKKLENIIILELLDSSKLRVTKPNDNFFEDSNDYGVAEIYKCYEYNSEKEKEEKPIFFIGTASELECNLSYDNIKKVWQKIHGEAKFIKISETVHGIYKVRAEMYNERIHAISYFYRMTDDMLLECGMYMFFPQNKRILDKKLTELFEEFSCNCEFVEKDE